MRNILTICLLLISFLGAAQEFTREYSFGQIVENGERSEIIEEVSYITFNYQGTAKMQITFHEGTSFLLEQKTAVKENEQGEHEAYFEGKTKEGNPYMLLIEITKDFELVRLVFTENYYIILFNL